MSEPELHGAAAADPLEGKLARFFAAELRQAEADLRARPIRPPAAVRPRVHLAGLLAATGLVVAGILAFVVIPAVAPRFSATPGTSIPSAPPGSVAPTEPPATPSLPPAGVGGRYPDGIPRLIGGESVYRPAEAVRRARESGSDASFLAGAWWSYSDVPIACPSMIPPDQPLLLRCSAAGLADTPASARYWPVALAEGVTLPNDGGPFVLAVHARDRRAAECDSAFRAECEQTVVVDRVVWAGDEQTRTAPLTISQVVRQLRPVNQSISVAPRTAPNPCEVPWPLQTWEASGDARLATVAVFPTVADRELAQPKLGPDSFLGEKCALIIDRFEPAHWAVVENVMVLVTRDDPALVRSVVHALEGGLQYEDGIPRWIDGEPVFRPTEALEVATAASDDTPFLLGGWLEVFITDCFVPPDTPRSPLVPPCPGTWVTDAPGSSSRVAVVVRDWGGLPPAGAVVLRVHVHDPLARECDPVIRDACERAFVVEAVVWAGDP